MCDEYYWGEGGKLKVESQKLKAEGLRRNPFTN
jgi:hypothetical protein